MAQYLQLLHRTPDFTRLWGAQVVSLLGDWFNTIVLSALVVQYSPPESRGLAVGGLLIARFVPPMLLSPVAGVLVDRFDRRWLLIWSNVLRAGVVLMFLFVIDNPDLMWAIYALTVIQFTLSSVFEPGQAALIPNLVNKADLVTANALVSITWSVMLALGAIIGGVVATLLGAHIALVIDAATFVVAGFLIWQIKGYTPKRQQPRTTTTQIDQPQTGFRDGLRYLRRNPDAATAVLVKFGFSLGNVDALMTILATRLFVLGTDGQLSLGIMYSAFGIGALIGPLLFNRFVNDNLQRLRHLITVGFVFVAVGWLLLGFAGTLVLVCFAILIRAFGGSVNWTYSNVIIQKSTDDAYMGRVFSFDVMGFYFATVVSTLVHGALIDAVGEANTQLVALGTVIPALIVLVIWVMLVRWLGRHQQPSVQPAPASGD
ncbi:MAG: MFS transporter [Chloroflexi bacterium]|nr:MFS transporter [Chloroflexota bacterium]